MRHGNLDPVVGYHTDAVAREREAKIAHEAHQNVIAEHDTGYVPGLWQYIGGKDVYIKVCQRCGVLADRHEPFFTDCDEPKYTGD